MTARAIYVQTLVHIECLFMLFGMLIALASNFLDEYSWSALLVGIVIALMAQNRMQHAVARLKAITYAEES